MSFWGRGHDHIGNFNFRVEIEGMGVASFKQVEGMGSETEVIEYGWMPERILRKRPGRTKYFDITLKRGFVNDLVLWEWRKQVMDGHIERKSGSIVILGDDMAEVCRWNFFEAWPTKWKGLSLNGMGNDSVVEELTITLELLERDGQPRRTELQAPISRSRRAAPRPRSMRRPHAARRANTAGRSGAAARGAGARAQATTI